MSKSNKEKGEPTGSGRVELFNRWSAPTKFRDAVVPSGERERPERSLGVASNGWPAPEHDLCGWRYVPSDIQPPLKLAWQTAALGSDPLHGVTGADGQLAFTLQSGPTVVLDYDGKPLWTFRPGSGEGRKGIWPVDPPVFVGSRLFSIFQGRVQCFDRTCGTMLWELLDQKGRDAEIPIVQELRSIEKDFEMGLLTIAADGSPLVNSNLGVVRKIDMETGRSQVLGRWVGAVAAGSWLAGGFDRTRAGEEVNFEPQLVHIETGQVLRVAFRPECCIGNRLYASANVGVSCFDTTKETALWHWKHGSPQLRKSLATDGQALYCRLEKSTVAVQAETGEQLWQQPGKNSEVWEPIVSPSYLYSASYAEKRRDLCFEVLDKRTGQPVWRSEKGFFPEGYSGTMSIVAGRMFLAMWDPDVTSYRVVYCYQGS